MNTLKRTSAIYVLLLSLALSACAPGQLLGPQQTATLAPTNTPEATNTPVATATPAFTATPLPTDTLPPTLTPAPSKLTGTMIWNDHAEGIVGADVYLCSVTKDSCQLDPALKATTQAEGKFEFASLPAGTYVILYNAKGGSNPPAGTLDLSAQAQSCAIEGFLSSVSAKCTGKTPMFGEGTMTLAKDSKMSVSATGFSFSDASLYSEKYGLYLNFVEGKLLSVEMVAGKDQDIMVSAWAGN